MTELRHPVRVRWSNGHVDSASTWQGLLDKVRKSQWWAWSEEEFRLVLAKRSLRWSATEIDIDGDAELLFRELERARLVEVLGPFDNDYEEA